MSEEQSYNQTTQSAQRTAPKQKQGAKNGRPNAQAKKPKSKKQGSGAGATLAAFLVLVLAVYLVFSLFIAGLIYYSFNSTEKSTEYYALHVIYDEQALYKMDAQTANNEYGLYIPFNYLADIGAFGLSGDSTNATLFIVGTDDRIECTKNSSLVIINGNPVRIAAPILYEEEEYLFPVALIENYINGINVTYDDKKMVCKVATADGKSDVALTLKLPEALKRPDYFTHEDMYYPDQSNP